VNHRGRELGKKWGQKDLGQGSGIWQEDFAAGKWEWKISRFLELSQK
jgi:hypothetical protein